MSHVDLGSLTEFTAINLFASAISHRITDGTGITTREIADAQGRMLCIRLPKVTP